MSKLFSKVIIENIEKYNCNEKEAGLFVDIYNSTVKKMATTLARRAFYELSDFASIRVVDELRGYKDYSLEIEKYNGPQNLDKKMEVERYNSPKR
jgi:hypothetical protein